MTKETLEKANGIQDQIDQYDSILSSQEEEYYWCQLCIECANSSSGANIGRIPRPVLNRMLDVLKEERQKLIDKLEVL